MLNFRSKITFSKPSSHLLYSNILAIVSIIFKIFQGLGSCHHQGNINVHRTSLSGDKFLLTRPYTLLTFPVWPEGHTDKMTL